MSIAAASALSSLPVSSLQRCCYVNIAATMPHAGGLQCTSLLGSPSRCAPCLHALLASSTQVSNQARSVCAHSCFIACPAAYCGPGLANSYTLQPAISPLEPWPSCKGAWQFEARGRSCLYLDPNGAVENIQDWFMQSMKSRRLRKRAPGTKRTSSSDRPAGALLINGFTKVGWRSRLSASLAYQPQQHLVAYKLFKDE